MKKVLLTIMLSLLLTGCSTKEESKEIKIVKHDSDEITLNYTFVDDMNIIIETINNGDDIDYATINYAVYDKDNKLLGVEKQYLHSIVAKQKNLIKLSLSNIIDDKNEKAAKIEMVVKTGKYENNVEKSYVDNVLTKVSKSSTDGQLDLTITNNSKETIDNIEASVVFYKNGKIVDLFNFVAQNVESTYSDKVYIPLKSNSDGTMSYIDYDDVKVLINYAISYDEI